MELVTVDTSDARLLQLFSEYDDFMMEFLGEDRVYYIRYGEGDQIECAWLAVQMDQPVGCVAFRMRAEGVGEVKRLYVRPECRKQGVARRLLKAVEGHAIGQGCHTLFLDTRITLEPAVSLYHSFGFSITVQEGLYIQMEKRLAGDGSGIGVRSTEAYQGLQ